MTETVEFRDFLAGVFRDYILSEAKVYLSNLDEFRLDEKGEYRNGKELADIEAQVRDKIEKMSPDFLDELNVKGLVSPEDYDRKLDVLIETLRSYRDKFFKWLQEQ